MSQVSNFFCWFIHLVSLCNGKIKYIYHIGREQAHYCVIFHKDSIPQRKPLRVQKR